MVFMWRGKLRPMRRAKDTEIVWKDPLYAAAITKRTVPARYEPPVVLRSDEVLNALVTGHAVMTKVDMRVSDNRGTYPFAHLEHCRKDPDHPAPIPKGSLLMYAGPIRTTERKKVNGTVHIVSVVKHTFITSLGRCIIHNLNVLKSL